MESSYLAVKSQNITTSSLSDCKNCCVSVYKNPAIISVTIGSFIFSAGFFLLLASLQVLPHGVNSISLLGSGAKIGGAIFIGIGLMMIGGGIIHFIQLRNKPALNEEGTSTSILHHAIPAGTYELQYLANGSHKKVYNIQDTDLVLKEPGENDIDKAKIWFRNECLAFLISEKLNLGIVLFVALVDAGKISDQRVCHQYPGLREVISQQQGGRLVMLQQCMPESIKKNVNPSINIEDGHKALFFNLITGRGDTKQRNSIVDKNGHIWEVDNDYISGRLSGDMLKRHWLANMVTVWEAPISDELLNHILISDLDMNPNIENTEDLLSAIKSNLLKVKNIIIDLRKTNLTVTFTQILSKL